jgi:hypothetical protein
MFEKHRDYFTNISYIKGTKGPLRGTGVGGGRGGGGPRFFTQHILGARYWALGGGRKGEGWVRLLAVTVLTSYSH